MDNRINDSYLQQLQANLRLKSTDELLDIWEENDHSQWSDEAFNIIRQLVKERTGSVPEQDPWPRTDEDVVEPLDEDEEPDTYHKPDTVLRIAALANIFSWFVLVGRIGLGLLQVQAATFETTVYSMLNICLIAGVDFFVLQAISHGLKLLMDIQENMREDVSIQGS